MIKKIALSAALCCTFGFAEVLIDGIAAKVNGEVITLYEIYAAAKTQQLSREDAIERLIIERLKESEIKRLKIGVDEIELQREMERVAKENNLRLYEFRNELRSRYGSVEPFENDLKNRLKQEKLARELVDEKLKNFDEGRLKEYYESNKGDFSIAKRATIIKYFSPNRDALDGVTKGVLIQKSEVGTEEESIELEKISPTLASLINKTQIGTFSPIIPLSNMFVSFFVKDKNELSLIPFEESKNMIFQKMLKSEQQKILKDHFEKLRAEARVEVLRMP